MKVVEQDMNTIKGEIEELKEYKTTANSKIALVMKDINTVIDAAIATAEEETVGKEKGVLSKLFSRRLLEFNSEDEAKESVISRVNQTQEKFEENLHKAQVAIINQIQLSKVLRLLL